MTGYDASILIVEDEPAVRNLFVALLAGEFRCQTAESAEAAIALLDAQPFHLVLADIGLPGTSGLEMCRMIAARESRPAVILVSGKIDLEAAAEARRAGAFDFLQKPFNLDDVVATVRCALADQARQPAIRSASSD